MERSIDHMWELLTDKRSFSPEWVNISFVSPPIPVRAFLLIMLFTNQEHPSEKSWGFIRTEKRMRTRCFLRPDAVSAVPQMKESSSKSETFENRDSRNEVRKGGKPGNRNLLLERKEGKNPDTVRQRKPATFNQFIGAKRKTPSSLLLSIPLLSFTWSSSLCLSSPHNLFLSLSFFLGTWALLFPDQTWWQLGLVNDPWQLWRTATFYFLGSSFPNSTSLDIH